MIAKINPAMYTQLSSDHPIDLCRYQVVNCYSGRISLINSGGESKGETDLAEAVKTAVINKRAGGAGIPAFFTKTGVGTIVADGKEIREFDGQNYVMERSLVSDVSLVKAYKADKAGNLVYRKTARNFNPNVAMAGKITVAEVEVLVEIGELDPDEIHTPGIYVQRIVVNAQPEKRIEQRTVRPA